MTKLSVVVGTLDRLARLRACLESIFAQTTTPARVYVTDAGSTDGTVEYLRSVASDRLVPILAGRRLGQARAYNEVFARVETPYTCWLSDDNVIVDRGLDVGLGILQRHAWLGMVALKVKDVTGPFVHAPYVGGISSIGILNVNQGLVRTEILKAVGGFSERFRDYGIDPDLTAKVLFSGHAVAYTRRVAIHHYRHWSNGPAGEAYSRQMERQRVYLRLYDRKYRGVARGGAAWTAKRMAWRLVQRILGRRAHPDAVRPVLGLLARDWHNIWSGRYVSLLDPVLCRGKDYYLVQRCPSRLRPAALPSDPEETTDAARRAVAAR